MRPLRLLGVLIIFILGILAGFFAASHGAQASSTGNWTDTPNAQLADAVNSYNPFQNVQPKENPLPRIPQNDIEVYKDRVIIDVQNTQWATFTDTHSMEPVLFQGAYAIEVVPTSEDDIKVGDIVSYKSEYADGTIIHRVVYKGKDEQGTYFIMKGDNLQTSDPGRVRFSQMQRVVVAIIY